MVSIDFELIAPSNCGNREPKVHMTIPKTQKAALLFGPNDVRVQEVPVPSLQQGEVLVRIMLATTCGTDLKTFKRGGHPQIIKSLPSPLGHEMTGIIVRLAEGVQGFGVDDRVVIANSAPCLQCFYCEKEQFNLCEDIHFINGAYSQFLAVPERFVRTNLHKIPEALAYEKAVLTEPLACVLFACQKIPVEPGETVVVIGDGPMSFLFNQVLQMQKARTIVFGLDTQRLEWIKQSGADHVFDSSQVDVVKTVQGLTEGHGAAVAIEAVGLPQTWEQAVQLVCKGGRVLCYGGCAKGTEMKLDTYRLHYDEISILGTFHYTPSVMDEAIRLLAEGRVNTAILTAEQRTLNDLQNIFLGKDPKPALKYLIRP